MDEGEDVGHSLDLREPWAILDADQAWYDAWLRYLETRSEEDERQALLRAVPLLMAAGRRLQEDRGSGFIWAPMALGFVASALSDRLQGWGWPSLTSHKKGRGFNHLQIYAMGYAWAYIAAAKQKLIHDQDPMESVRRAYGRGKASVSRETIYRWRREHSLPPLDWYSSYFSGLTEDSTDRAQRFLQKFGASYQRRPSDTSPLA
jgi:hypothetical protein